MIYDPALQTLVYKCQCMNPSKWTGLGCQTISPHYCKGGKMVGQICTCENNDVKIELTRNIFDFDSDKHYLCINEDDSKLIEI